mmetsp:Transcript_25262/g.54609  ORF Transcript_25262/g.54609 Transcript_25262/m.54609 type:complete len:82 (+) Transcript_25262:219-464(+)
MQWTWRPNEMDVQMRLTCEARFTSLVPLQGYSRPAPSSMVRSPDAQPRHLPIVTGSLVSMRRSLSRRALGGGMHAQIDGSR